MNSLPRPAVLGAALSLFGVSLLGLYIGVHDSLSRPFDEPTATGAASTVALRPGMAAAIPAQPLKPDALPPSSAAPAQIAQASSKPAQAASDDDNQDQDAPESSAPAARHVPEPPPLYPLDQPQAPPPVQPPSQDNTPPF